MNSKNNRLEAFREKIDNVDSKLLALLDKRFGLVKELGKIKEESGFAVSDFSRERKVLERAKKSKHSLNARAVLKKIISESKKIQKKN